MVVAELSDVGERVVDVVGVNETVLVLVVSDTESDGTEIESVAMYDAKINLVELEIMTDEFI